MEFNDGKSTERGVLVNLPTVFEAYLTTAPNADVYQMLACCIRLRLQEGWLVYADLDSAAPASTVVPHAGVTIHVESLDGSGTVE